MRNQFRRNKRHQPRPVDPIGGLSAILKRQPIDPEKQTEVSIEHWLAFDRMTTGQSSFLDWRAIAASLNASVILAERGLGIDYLPYVIAALDEMHACEVRAKQTSAWRFTGPGLSAVREALSIVDEQIKHASREQIRKALLEADLRARNGNGYPQAA